MPPIGRQSIPAEAIAAAEEKCRALPDTLPPGKAYATYKDIAEPLGMNWRTVRKIHDKLKQEKIARGGTAAATTTSEHHPAPAAAPAPPAPDPAPSTSTPAKGKVLKESVNPVAKTAKTEKKAKAPKPKSKDKPADDAGDAPAPAAPQSRDVKLELDLTF